MVIKDRVFFIFNYERRIDASSTPRSAAYPRRRCVKESCGCRARTAADAERPGDYAGGPGLAQFPEQAPASELLNNSKGISGAYTAVLTPNLVNVFTFGYTRQGLEQSGVVGTAFQLNDISPLANYDARASGRCVPVYNLVDNITWTKGRHTVTAGFNFRIIRNDRFYYAQSYPSSGYYTSVAVGLGQDVQNSVTDYLQTQTGNPSFALARGRPSGPLSLPRLQG